MNKIVVRVFVITLSLSVCAFLSACGGALGAKAGSPTDTVAMFVDKTNQLDVDGMIQCLDPTSQAAADATFGLADTFAGMAGVEGSNSRELVNSLIMNADTLSSIQGGSAANLTITASDYKETITGDEAVVSCQMHIESSSNGSTYAQDEEAVFDLKKFDGEWKIILDWNQLLSSIS